MRQTPRKAWAESRGLLLDDDGVLWLRLIRIDDEDTFANLGPIEWVPEVPRGLRGEFLQLEDAWRDAKREDPAAERHADYLLAISG